MNNIFENAKLLEKFLTRGGMILRYIGLSHDKMHVLVDEIGDKHQFTNSDGSFFNENVKSDWDIISKYKEPINRYKLDNETIMQAAKKYCELIKYRGLSLTLESIFIAGACWYREQITKDWHDKNRRKSR